MVDPSNPVVVVIADVEVPIRVGDNRDGIVEARCGGGAAVSRVPRLARSGDGRDDPVLVDAANPFVRGVGDQEVPVRIEADALDFTELRRRCRASVA